MEQNKRATGEQPAVTADLHLDRKLIKPEDRLEKIRIYRELHPVLGGQPTDERDNPNDNNTALDLACTIKHDREKTEKALSGKLDTPKTIGDGPAYMLAGAYGLGSRFEFEDITPETTNQSWNPTHGILLKATSNQGVGRWSKIGVSGASSSPQKPRIFGVNQHGKSEALTDNNTFPDKNGYLSNKKGQSDVRTVDDNKFKGFMEVQAESDIGTGVFLICPDGKVRGQMVYNDYGLQFAQVQEDGTAQTFTFPRHGRGGEIGLKADIDKKMDDGAYGLGATAPVINKDASYPYNTFLQAGTSQLTPFPEAANIINLGNWGEFQAQIGVGLTSGRVYVRHRNIAWKPHAVLATTADLEPPVDQIFVFESATPPAGYIARNGQAIDRSEMPKLYARYGANMPDDRDRALRMAGSLAGTAGNTQEDGIKRHTGYMNGVISRGGSFDGGVFSKGSISPYPYKTDPSGTTFHAADRSFAMGDLQETRVKSRIVIFCNKIQ